MTSGSRASAEAVARNREKCRERARLRRLRMTAEEHEADLEARRLYESKNAGHINELRRTRYGADIDALAARPFIFWDGEGYSTWVVDSAGVALRKHFYMLFGCSADIDNPLVGRDLDTVACLDYMLSIESAHPKAFHVGFAFDYDVNMILGDLPVRCLRHLAEYGVVHWKGYRIAYIPGKRFTVSKGNPRKGEVRTTVTLYDMFGFFHSKYTTSLLKFGVATEAELKTIIEGKEERPNFTYLDMEYVKRYWQDEISMGPRLADKVRDACYDAGMYVTQWHGPGALAAYLLRKRGVRKWQSKDVPVEAQIACRYAYAGGRFQFWRCGLYHHRIYSADINSAYIYACSLLPNLSTGRWRRVLARDIDRTDIAAFALYKIRYNAGTSATADNHRRGAFEEIHPLFCRDKRGNLYWPARVTGWYWSPEARTVANNPHAEFLEAWIYDDDGDRPFQWVHSEFDKRLQLQHANDPAEKTFKWGLAAMYGAFARTVGWDTKRRCAPASHELMWAGFITSWCRAEMFKLAYECSIRGGLISVDTDGVTSTVPFKAEWLERGEGEKLGQWKLEESAGILYWGSGFYWLLDDSGEWSTCKTRGIKRGTTDVQEALKAYETSWRITKTMTKFTGFKEALKKRNGMDKWRTWGQFTYRIRMGTSDHTWHVRQFCIKCRVPDADQMHVVTHGWPREMESYPHKLPWLEMEEALPEVWDSIFRVEDEADNL